MKWGLKGGISIDADSGPPRYVLWCCSGICHQLLTFFQIGCGHTVYLDIRASCKISWKHLFLGFFLVICQTGWRILLFLDCFFTFIWPLKVIKTLFTYFNHQIKSITSLNCNTKLIQFVLLRGNSALWYLSSEPDMASLSKSVSACRSQ